MRRRQAARLARIDPGMNRLRALDLFAGTGWGVACQRLGIPEVGVEIMAEARATRTAAGMTTVFDDVWEGLRRPGLVPEHNLLIASPPCQSFSVAGKGEGRRALDQVLELVHSGKYTDVAELEAFAESHDPRTALVLTPLSYALRFQPDYVLLEQVPAVLPVWEAILVPLERHGYSVWTGIIHAEQYGVPQTRKRAFLIARRDGVPAAPPAPTHSKYYPRDPSRLDDAVAPWVSMAEALGWGHDGRPSWTVTGGGGATGGAEPYAHGARTSLEAAIVSGHATPRIAMLSNYSTHGDYQNRGQRDAGQPAPTVTSKIDRNRWIHLDPNLPATTVTGDPRLTSREHHEPGGQARRSTRLTLAEAALLQTFPADFPFQGGSGKQFLQVGNAVPPRLAEALLAHVAATMPGARA